MSETFIIEHSGLTAAVKIIFGDIVDKCLVSLEKFTRESDKAFRERLGNVDIDIQVDLNNSSNDWVQYNGENVFILFMNGKLVEFSNSEWGSFSPAKMCEMKIIKS